MEKTNFFKTLFLGLPTALGSLLIALNFHLGRYAILICNALKVSLTPPWRFRALFKQMELIGVNSIIVVLVTAFFTGAVFTLQIIYGFRMFSAENMVGMITALALTRELSPVLMAFMVTGRVGSAIAAEIGAMRVTEQIDALTMMAANPIKFLISPRIIAGTVMMPLLVAFANFIGLVGGYIIAVGKGVDPAQFIGYIEQYLMMSDITNGLIKAAVFGFILTSVSCYMGYYAKGGAEGVGQATTKAVVTSYISILISDFLLTAVMF